MRNQAVFTASRIILINRTLAEIEDYLETLASEVATNKVAVEEKVMALTAISREGEYYAAAGCP